MRKVFYTKETSAFGKAKYVPVAEYDSDFLDSFTHGSHLVISYPGGQSRKSNIDPNYAAMIAAGRVAEDAICRAISKAAELRPPQTAITPKQKKAWQALATAFGSDICTLRGLSIHDCADAGIKAMMEEANKLMEHPAVLDAYNQFQTVCNLVKQQQKT